MKIFLKRNQGFTLIEILAAITILSLILVPMFSFFTQAATYTTKNKDKTIAVNIARGVMEYLGRQDFQLIKAELETKKAENPSIAEDEIEVNHTILICAEESVENPCNNQLYNYPPAPSSDFENIMINGTEYQVTLTTKFHNESELRDLLIKAIVKVESGTNSPYSLEGSLSNESIR